MYSPPMCVGRLFVPSGFIFRYDRRTNHYPLHNGVCDLPLGRILQKVPVLAYEYIEAILEEYIQIWMNIFTKNKQIYVA